MTALSTRKVGILLSSTALIELKNITKHYFLGGKCINALNNISLTINQYDFVALLGPSGSGKTTACNIMGLLDQPNAGQVYLNQQLISYQSDKKLSQIRNCEIGMVFQNFNLMPVLSALENVMLPLQIKGIKYQAAQALAEQQLIKLGLEDNLLQRPSTLSGGQQQRVAIGRALVTQPALIIADEPTANLDSKTAQGIIDLMMEINCENGTTFIFSTHDQRLLAQVKRQVLLSDGMICDDKRL